MESNVTCGLWCFAVAFCMRVSCAHWSPSRAVRLSGHRELASFTNNPGMGLAWFLSKMARSPHRTTTSKKTVQRTSVVVCRVYACSRCKHWWLLRLQSQVMKLDEAEEAEGLPACCFRRSVAVQNIDVRHPGNARNALSLPRSSKSAGRSFLKIAREAPSPSPSTSPPLMKPSAIHKP